MKHLTTPLADIPLHDLLPMADAFWEELFTRDNNKENLDWKLVFEEEMGVVYVTVVRRDVEPFQRKQDLHFHARTARDETSDAIPDLPTLRASNNLRYWLCGIDSPDVVAIRNGADPECALAYHLALADGSLRSSSRSNTGEYVELCCDGCLSIRVTAYADAIASGDAETEAYLNTLMHRCLNDGELPAIRDVDRLAQEEKAFLKELDRYESKANDA